MNIEAIEPQQAMAAATAATSVAAASVADGYSLAWLGVPMAVVLAAFAGAMVALTFMSGQGPKKAILIVLSGTAGGAYLAPLAIKVAAAMLPAATATALVGMDRPVAFLLGLGFQVAVPMFLAKIEKGGTK